MLHDWSCLNVCTSPCDWYKNCNKIWKAKSTIYFDGVKAKKRAMLGVEGRNGKRVNKGCNQCFIDTLIT